MLLRILMIAAIVFSIDQASLYAEGTQVLEKVVSSARSEAARLTVIGSIRAKIMDRKDIKSRYIRVRFDGKTLQLAGFVQSTNIAADVEQIARTVVQTGTIETYWKIEKTLKEHEPYKTHVEEQAADFAIWAKVKASLASPDVRPLLKNTDVQAVDVDHGNVIVYLIAAAPTGEASLDPHIQDISGVKSLSYRVLKTFQ